MGFGCQQLNDSMLHQRKILRFVHQNVGKLALPIGKDLRILQNFQRPQEHIVKIHPSPGSH